MRLRLPKSVNRSDEELKAAQESDDFHGSDTQCGKDHCRVPFENNPNSYNEAMTGALPSNLNPLGHQTAKQKDDITAPARICNRLKFRRPQALYPVRRSLRPSDNIRLIFPESTMIRQHPTVLVIPPTACCCEKLPVCSHRVPAAKNAFSLTCSPHPESMYAIFSPI